MAEQPRGLDAYLSDAIEEHYVEDEAPKLPLAEPQAGEDDALTPIVEKLGDAEIDNLIDEAAKELGLVEPVEPAREGEPQRGPDGKFLPRDKAKVATSEDGQVAAEAKPTDQQQQGVTARPAQQVALPDSWSAEWKAKVATLPSDQQQLLVEQYKAMQGDYTRKTQELSERAKTVEPLLATTQQFSPFLQQIGYTPDRFMAESVAVAQRLMSGQPQYQGQAIAYLMQNYRIPPEAVLQALGVPLNPGETVAVNPVTQQSQQQIFELGQRLQNFEQSMMQDQRMRAQAEFDAIGQTHDQNGNPLYPHWDRVRDVMIEMVANGRSQSWDDAYRKAVRLDDELYAQEIEAKTRSTAQAEQQRRQEAVSKAKRAQPVVTSPSAPAGGRERKGLDAHLSAAIDQYWQE